MLCMRLISAAILAVALPAQGWAGGMTLAHPYPAGSSFDIWARDLAGCIEERIGIYTEVIGDGKLGRSRDLAKIVAAGIVDAAILPAAAFADVWPELAQLDTPGYVVSTESARHLSGDPYLSLGLETSGGWERDLAVLGVGWRYSLLVGRNLEPDRFRGSKVRTAGAAQAAFIQALGATAVPIPAAETFAAMEYGVVDTAVVDADQVQALAQRTGLVPIAWSDQFTPFVSAHVAVMSQARANVFGLKGGRRIAELCAEATLDFTERSIGAAHAAAEFGPAAGTALPREWIDAIPGFQANLTLDSAIRRAVEASLGSSK